MNWADRREVRKGSLGEEIVDEWLNARGVIVYKPNANGAHPFDRLIATKTKRIAIVEVKSKPSRRHYPDTGINLRTFHEYITTCYRHRMMLFLIFVDENKKLIYGQWLHVLQRPYTTPGSAIFSQEYPWEDRGIIYFPLAVMRPIAELPDDKVVELRALRRSSYDDPSHG